jgi:hypothetical protein
MILLNLDAGNIMSLAEDFRPAAEQALREAVGVLSAQAHAHVVERVQQQLHSSREKYVNALRFQQLDDHTWVISLDAKALWIEEGLPADFDMLPGLLGSRRARTASDGSRYLTVPFEHGQAPTRSTPAQQTLTETIRAELRQRQIPFKTIERDSQGRPKLGLLHSLDILQAPLKTGVGPGQGRGPLGAVRQGPTGIPFLQRLRIYQRQTRDAAGKERVQRGLMTFRTASSKHQGQDRWKHPGLAPKLFLDEAADWALRQWDQRIRDQVLASVVGDL